MKSQYNRRSRSVAEVLSMDVDKIKLDRIGIKYRLGKSEKLII